MLLFWISFNLLSHAEEMQFFSEPDIDFFKEKPTAQVGSKVEPAKIPKVSESPTQFPWKKYLDPKNDEFFREGDYLPPAPFMEIARNPNDENIKNWFQFLETKNAISQRLSNRLAQFTGNQAKAFNPPAPQPPLFADAKSTRIRMYFDSKCPHCHRMFGELSRLKNQGFWIETRQIDSDASFRRQISFPVTTATKEELSQYKVESVPTLLIANLKSGSFQILKGFQSAEAVVSAIQQSTENKGEIK